LLENVELGVIGFSLDGKITFANRFVERLLDYGAGDLVGENVINLAPNHLREELTARLDRARRLGARSQVDFPLVSKGGDTKEIRWSFVSLRNDNDEISGYLAICDDLTALKRAEAALRSSEREIERFDRAALMVEIGASLGHELNQPLAAILINGQTGKRMLGSDPVPLEDIAEIFTDIIDDTTRAGRVVESVRGILRRGEMKQVASDLKPLFEEVNHILRGELLKKRIKIIIDFQDNLPKVFVGRIEIQQVFLNILNNSVRILNSNGVSNPSIKVSAHRSGEMVKIRVSDNGPGIAEPTLRKIFDPFVTSRADGLGMGLAISRRIVDLHGGCLHCESRLGNGACFEFTLPIAFNGRGSVDGRESTDSLYH
jgi:PAS domain S-box-containing protein